MTAGSCEGYGVVVVEEELEGLGEFFEEVSGRLVLDQLFLRLDGCEVGLVWFGY